MQDHSKETFSTISVISTVQISTMQYVCTSVDEFEDTSEAGVVGLNVVCVEFENEVARGRVESSLRE